MSSKIKVDTIENVAGSGNVSLGSGHNLVVPGNITGQGTAAITSNATVGGTLGVTGTTTTAQINASGSINTTANTISVTNSSYPQLQLNSGVKNYHIFNDTGSNSLYFKNNTDNVNAMIMSANGHVTKPLTPFVRLQLTSHVSPNTTVSAPGNQVTGFTVRENVGSYWNSSNNNFTCPVAGVYSASVFYIKYPISGNAHVDLHKNGVKVNEIRWRAPEVNAGYHQAGGTASVTCAANDVLDWHYFGSAGVHDGNGSWEIMLSH